MKLGLGIKFLMSAAALGPSLGPAPGDGAIAPVQNSTVANAYNVNGAAIPLTFSTPLTAGNIVVVALGLRRDPAPANINTLVSSVTATGVTFTRTFTQELQWDKKGTEIWIGVVNTGGATVVNITPANASGNFFAGAAAEFSGMDVDSLVADTDGGFAGNGAASTTVNGITPAKANSLLIGSSFMVSNVADVGWSVPSGMTEIGKQVNAVGDRATLWFGYQILAATTVLSKTFASTQNDTFGRCAAAVVLNGEA